MTGLEGKNAPAFSLQGGDGKTHALRDYAGRTLVLYFSKPSSRPPKDPFCVPPQPFTAASRP